jgi:hypothetical protein
MLSLRTTLGIGATALGAAGIFLGAGMATANSTGGGAVVGHGTISPGLTTTPTYQTISFTGTLAAAGNPASKAGTYTCNFTGSSSIAETLQKGKGTAKGSCSGSKGTATATVRYGRNGGVVTLNGSSTGALVGTITGVCNFVPTTAPKVKAYQLQCGLAIK